MFHQFRKKNILGFQATIVRADAMAARSDSMHPDIMAFMSDEYYTQYATDLFSSWTNTSTIDGAILEVAIMDQPSCESAQMSNANYACATNSNCRNASSSYRGHHCYCSSYPKGNPYLLEGCTAGAPPHPHAHEHIAFSAFNHLFLLSVNLLYVEQITTPRLNNTARRHVET